MTGRPEKFDGLKVAVTRFSFFSGDVSGLNYEKVMISFQMLQLINPKSLPFLTRRFNPVGVLSHLFSQRSGITANRLNSSLTIKFFLFLFLFMLYILY